MKLLGCASYLLLLGSIQAFQFVIHPASLRVRPHCSSSTRQWTLKEPNGEVDTQDKVAMEEANGQEASVPETVLDEADVFDLSPSEDSPELSRDEEFMRLAIELAEEE